VFQTTSQRRIGSAPGEDRLLVVAYGEKTAMPFCKKPKDLVLIGVEILELVDKKVIPASLVASQYARITFEQETCQDDDVVVVDKAIPAQFTSIGLKQCLITRGKGEAREPMSPEQN